MCGGMRLPRPTSVSCPTILLRLVAQGKRPLSSSCPYIVERDGKPVLAGGAAGGSTIISANVQVVRNTLDYGQTCAEALDTVRLHNQVLPDVTLLERPTERGRAVKTLDEVVVKGLEKRGHKIEWVESEHEVEYSSDSRIKEHPLCHAYFKGRIRCCRRRPEVGLWSCRLRRQCEGALIGL